MRKANRNGLLNQTHFIPFSKTVVHETCFMMAGGGMATSVEQAEKCVRDYILKQKEGK